MNLVEFLSLLGLLISPLYVATGYTAKKISECRIILQKVEFRIDQVEEEVYSDPEDEDE